MFRTSGTCVNIRVARSSHSEQQILDNLYAVLVQAVENVPKKWGNVQVCGAGHDAWLATAVDNHGVSGSVEAARS
jgi:hypothetical protein